MAQNDNVAKQPIQPAPVIKPMLIGAAIGLLVISFFVFRTEGDPDWGKYWRIRPLIITPLAGAMGGLFYYFMDYLSGRGFNRTVAIILSLLVFIVGLWMGIVLGLDGTMWD